LANALNITSKNAGVMIDILKRACDDEHYTVRGCAAKALGNLRYTNSTVIRLLRSMLEDPDDFVKITAKNALEKLYVE
jgi:HEAT repeat protein